LTNRLHDKTNVTYNRGIQCRNTEPLHNTAHRETGHSRMHLKYQNCRQKLTQTLFLPHCTESKTPCRMKTNSMPGFFCQMPGMWAPRIYFLTPTVTTALLNSTQLNQLYCNILAAEQLNC